jgi:hypothetical protein
MIERWRAEALAVQFCRDLTCCPSLINAPLGHEGKGWEALWIGFQQASVVFITLGEAAAEIRVAAMIAELRADALTEKGP